MLWCVLLLIAAGKASEKGGERWHFIYLRARRGRRLFRVANRSLPAPLPRLRHPNTGQRAAARGAMAALPEKAPAVAFRNINKNGLNLKCTVASIL